MKNFRKILLSLILMMGTCIYAQQETSFTEGIIGRWEGEGTLFGTEASFSMHWENALDNKFMELDFMNRFTDKSGTDRIMKAKGYYSLKENKGYWFDTRGVMQPLTLKVDKESMTVLWGAESTEKGKTIYTLINNMEVGVEDFVYKDNDYLLFGKAMYKKIGEEEVRTSE